MRTRRHLKDLVAYRADAVSARIVLNANETNDELFSRDLSFQRGFARYPEPAGETLRDRIAEKHGLKRGNVIIGNGSTELLELLVKTYVEQDEKILTWTPTFSMYEVYARIHGAQRIGIPLVSEASVDHMVEAAQVLEPKLIFLCNPNNPTGTIIRRKRLIELIEKTDALVVIDEAYMDFALDRESLLGAVGEYPNVVVTRTFSKAYGLAFARLGYLVGPEAIVENLLRVQLPYPVSGLSQELGLRALEREKEVEKRVKDIIERREDFYRKARALGMKVDKSAGNFLLIESPYDLYRACLRKGILIRSFGNGTYRISIGTKEEMEETLDVLREVYA
ncbi:MAG: histidinol-phosphate transaminase [Acholeplasmataceae bacterium]